MQPVRNEENVTKLASGSQYHSNPKLLSHYCFTSLTSTLVNTAYKASFILHDWPLVVPFSRPAVALLSLRSRFSVRSRGYLRANVTFPEPLLGGVLSRNRLKQRRDSVSYPSIHPRQIRDKRNEVFYTGQDEDKMSNKRSTTHAVCLHCSITVLKCEGNASQRVDVSRSASVLHVDEKHVGGVPKASRVEPWAGAEVTNGGVRVAKRTNPWQSVSCKSDCDWLWAKPLGYQFFVT